MRSELPRHQRPTTLKTFLFGTPYYPEHWTTSDRAEDSMRMAAAGMNVVRMAEFAWDLMEPKPGTFNFTLFDETIAKLGEKGIQSILCTPTATPPRWLTADHPEWMRQDVSGRRMEHGSRQHVCTNNEEFRVESRRITVAMAEHFRNNPHVIGWQTDNELYCHISECFCPPCRHGFQEWLAAKYGDIQNLNQTWGNAFWALTYDRFEQIPPAIACPPGAPTYPNPTHHLEWYRYLSDSLTAFQREQVDILRRVNPKWWITHNGLMNNVDYWKFSEDLDFLGVDIYPGFAREHPQGSFGSAITLEKTRAASGGFIVPEQQSGAGGQAAYIHETPRPGQMRLWAWQSIAYGADGLLHFRWRTCRFGAETYWHGILDHDNVPRRRYQEFSQEGAELTKIGPKILGTVKQVEVGVVYSHDQQKAHQTLPMGLLSPFELSCKAFHQLWRWHLPAGLVDAADAMRGLKIAIIPSLPLADAALARKWMSFVEAGGVLLVTARTGCRNANNQAYAEPRPGVLTELCGVVSEDWGKIEPGSLRMLPAEGKKGRSRGPNKGLPSGQIYEILRPTTATVLARWSKPADGSPHAAAGEAAICVNPIGKGKVIYVGTYFSDENRDRLLALALGESAIKPLAKGDEFVEVTCRQDRNRRLVFVMNHYAQPKKVSGLAQGRELITDQVCKGTLQLAPYAVAVVEEEL